MKTTDSILLSDNETYRIKLLGAKPVLDVDHEVIGVARSKAGAVHCVKCVMKKVGTPYSFEEYGEIAVTETPTHYQV